MKGPGLKEQHEARLKAAAEYAARSKEGIAAALRDARAARLATPGNEHHAHRFMFGFVAPLTLLRLAWGDAATRKSMVQRLTPPVLCLALAAVVSVWATSGRDEAGNKRITHALQLSDDDEGKDRDQDKVDEKDSDDDDEKAALPPEAVAAIAKARTASALARAAAPPPPPAAPPPPPPKPKGWLQALRATVSVLTSRVVAVLAALGVVEWILVWIGREHHDHMAYEISSLTRVPGEEPPGPPRLRLDFGWLWLKTWRTVRFLLFLALASPIAWVLGLIPVVGGGLSVAVEGAWTAYWASVFAIANSFLAWGPRPDGETTPWFIRVLARAGKVPIVGLPFRLYARILTLATRNVWPACLAFEWAPWEAAGLALARVVASLPFVYLIFRPVFAPAATHALMGPKRGETTPPPAV